MTDISALPDSQQFMVVGSVVVITSVWAVIKFLKPFIDHLAPKPAVATGSTDTVVISGAFADSRPINDLNVNIERMNGLMGRLSDSNERLCIALDAQSRASLSVADGARQKIESDLRVVSEMQMLAQALNRYGERK